MNPAALRVLLLGMIMIWTSDALAQETPPVDLMGETIRIFGYLLLLMAMGGVAVRLGRKYLPPMGGTGPIRIEDGRNFAPGVGVRLIRIGSRAWLLGVSKDHVSLLAEMRPEDLDCTKEAPS